MQEGVPSRGGEFEVWRLCCAVASHLAPITLNPSPRRVQTKTALGLTAHPLTFRGLGEVTQLQDGTVGGPRRGSNRCAGLLEGQRQTVNSVLGVLIYITPLGINLAVARPRFIPAATEFCSIILPQHILIGLAPTCAIETPNLLPHR